MDWFAELHGSVLESDPKFPGSPLSPINEKKITELSAVQLLKTGTVIRFY